MTSGNRKRVAASVVILALAGFLLVWQSGAVGTRVPGGPAYGPTDPDELEQRNRDADPRTNPGQIQGLVREVF